MEIKEYYYETIGSTNDEAKKFAASRCPEGTVISAGCQTAGRGRRGRSWETAQNESIATSMVLYPTVPIACVPSLTLVAAMAVRSAVSELYELDAKIKWPNDIVLQNKKICGILTEMSVKDQKAEYVIVGIGINVHNRSFDPELEDKAISIDQLLPRGNRGDCGLLRQKVWQCFAGYYETFQKTADLSGIREEYNRHLVNCNRQVKILDPNGAWVGIARGIDVTGALMVETPDGMRLVDSGEVSVRGMYGYV